MASTGWKAFGIVTAAYALAFAAAVGAVSRVPGANPLLKVALGTLVATLVVFAFSRVYDNTSLYDPYWSVAPMVAGTYLYVTSSAATTRGLLLLGLVMLWGWRLTLNWARSWKGLTHEDWRYVDMRTVTGSAYWWASAFALHLFPTVIVFLGLMPLPVAMSAEQPLGLLDALAFAVTLGAIAIETFADEQLKHFRARPSAAVCDVGLWRYSRHPNYFGELSFWVGLWLFGVAARAPWWTALGPLAMFGLFVFASIPLMERHLAARRAGYADHCRRTSMLFPWPPRRDS